jgi:hypothetical protein
MKVDNKEDTGTETQMPMDATLQLAFGEIETTQRKEALGPVTARLLWPLDIYIRTGKLIVIG